jgi:CRISPR-associated protein Csy2
MQVQGVNAISGPLSWGFPSPTAFLGFAHALQRRLADEWDTQFTGVGIICHRFTPLTSRPAGRHHQVFRLARHPVRAGYKKYEDKDAALVEEGRAHMEISLLLETTSDEVEDEQEEFLQSVMQHIHGMRLAGGSILPAFDEKNQPRWQTWWDAEADNRKAFLQLRRKLLPGFALVQRQDLLEDRLNALRAEQPEITALDALLDLCALHVDPETDEKETVHWRHHRAPGWLVPLPVGYGALSGLYPPGTVANTRDEQTPFRFVESLYSLGQWLGPHRIQMPDALMWRYNGDAGNGLYLCVNPYSQTLSD